MTVNDVARAAGASRQTVSNVLIAPDRVRPETRERVAQAIAELGYRPNRVARSLRAQASRMIGYRVEPAQPQYLASIHDRLLHALAEAGREQDHHLLLFTADGTPDEIDTSLSLYRTGAIDGRAARSATGTPRASGAGWTSTACSARRTTSTCAARTVLGWSASITRRAR